MDELPNRSTNNFNVSKSLNGSSWFIAKSAQLANARKVDDILYKSKSKKTND